MILRLVILLTIFLSISTQLANGDDSIEDYFCKLYKFDGNSTNQGFGQGVYLSGDIDGDGYGDILIGAYKGNSAQYKSAGKAFVYSGFDGDQLYYYVGDNDYAYLGRTLSSIDDTNGDGFPEILIGAEHAVFPSVGFLGRVLHCSGMDGSVIRDYWGERFVSSNFGCDLEGIGDANGDGYGDFVVGARFYSEGFPLKKGAAYVFSGHTGKLLYKYIGEYGGEELGFKVSRIGDLDKETLFDFAYLTLNNKTGNPSGGGRVTVRSGENGLIIKEILGELPNSPIYHLDYGGDINRDGWPDILISQSFDNGSILKAGRVLVYSGKDWKIIYSIVGQNENGGLGGAISTAGDINADGFCDFLIGAYGTNDLGIWYGGAVYLHSGKNGKILGTLYGNKPNEMMGITLHGGKDINADGLPDIIIGTAEEINGNLHTGSALVYAARSLKAADQVALGEELILDLRAPSLPFHRYYLAFSMGKDHGIPVGTRIFPLNLDGLFASTFAHPVFTQNLDGVGRAKITVRIPDNPSLSGIKFYSAFLVYDETAPKCVRTISNPEEIEIL